MGHLVVIRGERGGEGRTLFAHLLTAFLMDRGADWFVFHSAGREAPQRSRYSQFFSAVDIRDTGEQVRFVNTVLRAPDAWTLLDLAHADNRVFLDFCDNTNIIGELAENNVDTWSIRIYSQPMRDIRVSFWPDCLVDAREILVVNNSSPTHLRDWRASPMRTEFVERRVPELVLPRMDEGAIQHFLSQRLPLAEFLGREGSSGKDVFARAQLAKLFQVFQPQMAQFLLSTDLVRLKGPLFQ